MVPAPLETGNVTHEEEEDIRQGTTPHMPDDFFPSDTLPQVRFLFSFFPLSLGACVRVCASLLLFRHEY